jgi:hypothetical protein
MAIQEALRLGGAQAVPKMFDTLIGEKLQDTFPNELAISIVDSMSLEETH